MTPREVVLAAIRGETPPYVPWQIDLTLEAWETLQAHFGEDLAPHLGNHLVWCGSTDCVYEPLGNDLVQDAFGVVWDRSVDKDIGIVHGLVLPEPTLEGWEPPNTQDPRFYAQMDASLAANSDGFSLFSVGFSLYERAWTLRGMENLMMDFVENPEFVKDLLRRIADFNIACIHHACRWPIDCIRFGDDWGQQHGLQMGPKLWREFILPEFRRMVDAAKAHGKLVMLHSCGDVDELFDDLIEAGLDCFNPFQPEAMDVFGLMERYKGKLAFHGGLSTQRTLPYGTTGDVRAATQRLLEAGRQGGLIVAPAHAVEGDVPLENMLALLDGVQSQPGVGT